MAAMAGHRRGNSVRGQTRLREVVRERVKEVREEQAELETQAIELGASGGGEFRRRADGRRWSREEKGKTMVVGVGVL
jgi:hypothetical protein